MGKNMLLRLFIKVAIVTVGMSSGQITSPTRSIDRILSKCVSSGWPAPGYWKYPPCLSSVCDEIVPKWHYFDPECDDFSLVKPDLLVEKKEKPTILFLGDSVDRGWYDTACTAFGNGAAQRDEDSCFDAWDHSERCLRVCTLPGIRIVHLHLLGTSMGGPYVWNRTGDYVSRLNRALQQFSFPITEIKLVVASSMWWDLFRQVHQINPAVGLQVLLPDDVVQQYYHNLTSMLTHFRGMFPHIQEGKHFLFHTTRPGRTECGVDNWPGAETQYGGKSKTAHITQLNNVARMVVKNQEWVLLDIAQYLGGLSTDICFYDVKHPKPWVYEQMLHVLFCMAAPKYCRLPDMA